jgi:hypothetical protein
MKPDKRQERETEDDDREQKDERPRPLWYEGVSPSARMKYGWILLRYREE